MERALTLQPEIGEAIHGYEMEWPPKNPIQYKVAGMPRRESARIRLHFEGPHRWKKWQISRNCGEWTGCYETAGVALSALQQELID